MKKITLKEFIKKAAEKHGNKYSYDKVILKNVDTKIEIVCYEHGSFLQLPTNHLSGRGCKLCSNEKQSMGGKLFIENANKIHNSKYDYTLVLYKNTKTNVKIQCYAHGIFLQKPEVHLNGFGCPSCSGLSKSNTENFKQKAAIIHNNQYNYSLVEYINSRNLVKIICNNHGIFEQEANSHLMGRGCPKCLYHGQSETGKILQKLLPKTDIKYQYRINYEKTKFIVDFYFTIDYQQYIVEYNGVQHYQPVCFGNMSKKQAKKNLRKQKKRDGKLQKYCDQNNIILLTVDSRKLPYNKIEIFLESMLPIIHTKFQIFEKSYGFENVAIIQKKNICNSRLDVDVSSEIIKDIKRPLPLIAANMSTVVNSKFCIQLFKAGALGILHRADTKENILRNIVEVSKECDIVAASIGIDADQFDFSKEMIKAGCNIITIDVAHGYSDIILDLGRKIKNFAPSVKIIIGNATNIELMHECYDFADAVKVGIAQGLACETKNTAGCTEKQFSAVLKFKQISKDFGIPIISDGGIREPADFTKAIAAGANSVMAGSIFAACPESAAPFVYSDGVEKKLYAGMASRYVQDKWKGGIKSGTCPEGGVRYLDVGEPLDNLLERYSGALKSGITYAGANDIKSFQNNVEFVLLK